MQRYSSFGPSDSPPLEEGDKFLSGVNSYDAPFNLQPGIAQEAVNIDFTRNTAATRGGFVCIPELGNAPFNASSLWTTRTPAANLTWNSIAFGNGVFVAVASSGTGNRVMTSPDGITWTSRTSAADNFWESVAFGNGLFVAVSSDGAGNRVMTSVNGITWTSRTSAANNPWNCVVWGGSLFVAVSDTGSANRAMTSPDGITWTIRTTPNQSWRSITYGASTYVAVGSGGDTSQAMTSTDGITWTQRTTVGDGSWRAVTFGGSTFVATGLTGQVMTSSDGITWTLRTAAEANSWEAITYGNGLFIAVATSGTNRVQTSPDGINWTARSAASASLWSGIVNANNTFVAVADNGTATDVMTAGAISSVFASGIYSDPNDAGSQWIMLVGSSTVGFYAFGKQSRSVAISGYTVSKQSTVVQCNNQVYIFRGTDSTPLYWTGNWSTSFTVAPTPAQSAGFSIIPNSKQATYTQNRLWVVDGKDAVTASDVLDFTTFDNLSANFNVNTGNSDYIITTYPFGDNGLVVFKNKSSILLQNIQGSLADVTATEITRQLGIVGINAVTAVGPDLVYVSNRDVSSIRLNLQNLLQNVTEPLSRNIKSIIDRVNWNYAYKISMAYSDNKLYVALPLDNATVCSSIVVYNFVTQQWWGEWNFASAISMNVQGFVVATFQGSQHLHAITEDGRIFVTGQGQNDISGTNVAEISTSLTTRAYQLNDNEFVPRRMYVDLSTNRPSFSITAYADGASESEVIITAQTYSRTNSWLWADSTYTATNANDDYNRAFRQDYSTGPDSIQCGTGFQPEMTQDYRFPIITRRKGLLSWFKVANTTGFLECAGVGVEARASTRGSLVQVG